MRNSVVLPTPLGPTRPTRWPANNSKPMPSKSGPASKPRERSAQLRSSMALVGGGSVFLRGARAAGSILAFVCLLIIASRSAATLRGGHGRRRLFEEQVDPARVGGAGARLDEPFRRHRP